MHVGVNKLVHYRDNWYVDAWCHFRKEVRSFSVDAISSCEVQEQDAKDLDPDQLRLSMQRGYGIFGGAVKGWAKLKFSPERSRWVRNEAWHPEQIDTELPDGSFMLDFPYSDERELVGDILKYGKDVEVLAPKQLRQSVQKNLEQAIKNY